MTISTRATWIISIPLIVSCNGADLSVGETESALTGRLLGAWGTVDGPDLDMGDSANRTCFLAGVAGNLSGYPYNPGRAAAAGFYIDSRTNHYMLAGRGGRDAQGVSMGAEVNALGVCVYTTAGRTVGYWQSGVTGRVFLGARTATRQCFLQMIGASDSFRDSSAGVFLTVDRSGWWLDGTPAEGAFPVVASAVCVDITDTTGAITGTQSAPDPGTAVNPLIFDDGTYVCGLRGVWGHFTANDWNDGASLTWPSSLPGYWWASLKNGKTASLACLN